MITSNDYRNRFLALDTPSKKDENYRYTSLKEHSGFLELVRSGHLKLTNPTSHKNKAPKSYTNIARVILSAGKTLKYEMSENHKKELNDKGVVISLSKELQPKFEIPNSLTQDFFSNLCAGYSQASLTILVPKNTELTFSLELITEVESDLLLNKTIIIEEGSKFNFIDTISSHTENSDKIYFCSLDQFYTHKNSLLNYFEVDTSSNSSLIKFSRTFLQVIESAFVNHTFFHIGSLQTQKRVESHCKTQNSSYNFNGICALSKKQKLDLWTTTRHTAPHTTSSTKFSSILTDQSQSVFNGTLYIDESAPHTQADQSNKNITLSKNAHAISLPKLIISTDEVKCSHGATVSTLDPEQIYYLESRGIPQKQAELMILEGYFEILFSANHTYLPLEFKEDLKELFLKQFSPQHQRERLE